MRFLCVLAILGFAGPVAAQETHDTCVDVQVGSAQSYDCINQRLRTAAQSAPRQSSNTAAPYSATSPSNVTGQFNESATRNRLGSSFGHSVTPERPTQDFGNAFARPH